MAFRPGNLRLLSLVAIIFCWPARARADVEKVPAVAGPGTSGAIGGAAGGAAGAVESPKENGKEHRHKHHLRWLKNDSENPSRGSERFKGNGAWSGNGAPSSGGQVENVNAGRGTYGSGSGAASYQAQQAYDAAETNHSQAGYDRSVSRQLSEDQQRIESVTQPLLASNNAADRKKAEEFLARSASPPENFQDAYQTLDLASNRDVLERSPEFAQNLDKAGDNWQKAGDEWKSDGDKAQAAAEKMKAMESSLNQAGQKLGSVDPNSSAGFHPITGQNNSNLSMNGAGGAAGSSSASNTDGLGLQKPSANGGSGSFSALSGRENPNSNSGSSDVSALPELREQLRAKLAAAAARSGSSSGGEQPKSAFDSLFEKREPASVLTAAAGSNADVGVSAIANANAGAASDNGTGGNGNRGGFSLSGSETDAAIKRLTKGLDGGAQGSEERLYGSLDVTIFARMTKFLTKAQVDKRVAR